jgi:hypothetical protein
MIRFINYMIVFVILAAPIYISVGSNPFLYYPALVVMGLVLSALLDFVSFDDNLMLLGFLLCVPYMIYLSDLPVGDTSVWAFLSIVFLAVSLPFVLYFLFMQLTEPLEG